MKKFFAVLLTVLLLAGMGVGAYFFMTQESSIHEHQLGEWVLTKEATCLKDGVRERKCACGYSVKEIVKATGHVYGEIQNVEQTCTQDGCARQICANCGEELKTDIVKAMGHEYGDWVVAVAPTCTQTGMRKRTCLSCSEGDYQVMESTSHVFSTASSAVIDGQVVITEVCSACGCVSDESHEYESVAEDTHSDPYAFDCSTDFAFEIRCEKDEQYIYEHLRILDFYYEGTEYENTDTCLHPFVARKTENQHIWSIEPSVPYKENYTYVARLSGEMSLLAYKQDYLKFYIQGPEVAEVEYRDNILFLQALEEENPGYYPYDLSVDEEEYVMILTLSQTGVFTDEMIGKTLCVGPCSSTDELPQFINNCDIGVIHTIRWENDKTVVVLDAPSISDLYLSVNVSGNESIGLPEEIMDEAQLQELKYAFVESPGFTKITTAVFMATKSYAAENGYSVPHYTDLKFDPGKIKITPKVLTPDEMGDFKDAALGFSVTISYTYKPDLHKKDSGYQGVDAAIKVPIVWTCKVYLYPNASTSFDGVYDAVRECVTGDFRMHVDMTTVTDVSFSIGLEIEIEKPDTVYYAVDKSTGKIHSTRCKAISQMPTSDFHRKTLKEIIDQDKEYKEKSCSVCRPFSGESTYVVVNGEKLHVADCYHLKKVKNKDSIEAFETFPLTKDFTICADCLPRAEQSFAKAMFKSFKDNEWTMTLEGIRGYTKDVLKDSRKETPQIFGGNPANLTPVPIIPGAHIFNLDVYCSVEWDFDVEATFNLNINAVAITRFGLDLKREKGEGFDFDTFVVLPSFDKSILISNQTVEKATLSVAVTAMLQGKATVEIGVRSGIKLSLVGCQKLVYAGLDIVIGPYAELSGVLGFELSSSHGDFDSFAAARLEVGIFYKIRYEVFLKSVFVQNGSILEDKLPIYVSGDKYACYAFKDYEQTLNIGSDRNYSLPKDLLGVKYYDLEKMTQKEATLTFEGKAEDYSVKVVLRDKNGNPVDYCTYKDGSLTVEDHAPKQFEIVMEITVVDESVPQSLPEYLTNKVNRHNNGSYTVGSKEVIIRYESELADMAITSVTPITSPEIMEGEEVTFKITADQGVKYGVAFYYHNYQDELARFITMEDSYTVKISEAGTHMITVYPLDKNGEPIRGEGLGMSYRYVKAYSYDECAAPKITNEDGKTVKQGVPYMIDWNPSFYPTENVVYSVYLQNDTAGKYTLVAEGLRDTEVTIPADMLTDVGSYSVQVYANHDKLAQSDAATLIFTVKAVECLHSTVTEEILIAATCQQQGSVRKTCIVCHYSWKEVLAVTAHNVISVSDKLATCIEPGWQNRQQCSVCDLIIHSEALSILPHNYEEGYCTGCGVSEAPNGRHPSPTVTTPNSEIHTGDSFTVSWTPPQVIHGLQIVYAVRVVHYDTLDDQLARGDVLGTIYMVPGSFFERTGTYYIDIYAKAEGYSWSEAGTVCVTVTKAEEPELPSNEELKFISNGDGTCYVSGIGSCVDTEVVIPTVSPTGDVVTSIGESAFEGNGKLISVVIPEGVAKIESGAFQNCSALESIEIPNGLQEIGPWAFYGCVKLNNVSLPISLRKVYSGAFDNCTSLNTASYPASEEEWHKNVSLSADNKNLTDALGFCHHDVDDTFRPALGPVFRSNGDGTCAIIQFNTCDCCLCKGINSGDIVLPAYSPDGDRVTSIEGFIDGYSYGRHITSIAIPDSVESIGDGAFGMCYSLTDVYYDGTEAQWNSIRIGWNNDCLTLATLHFVEPEPTYSEGLSFASNGDGTCSVSGIGNCTDLDVVIPPASPEGDRVTSIGDVVFLACVNLTSITIPDSVTSIGDSAFRDCINLTNIKIPDSVTSIGDWVFRGCVNLTSITIPDSVTSIGDSAFAYCDSLTSITIPDSVTSIGYMTFNDCYNLKSVIIGNGVTSIGRDAFGGCQNLTSVIIPNSVTCIEEGSFRSCSGLTSITIGKGVKSIGYNAFTGCSELKSITVVEGNPVYHSAGECVIETANNVLRIGCSNSIIPADGSVTSIGDYAFFGCDSLKSITIPNSIISIGDCAFVFCTSLTSIIIPESVTSIGLDAFGGCDNLIQIENGVCYVDRWAIGFTDEITGNGLRSNTVGLGYASFSWCFRITNFVIPDGVIHIGDYAFSYSSNLTSVTIPDSVTSIGCAAFNSTRLAEVNYRGTCDQWKSIQISNGNDHVTIHCTDGYVTPGS